MKLAEWKGEWAIVTGASSGIGREFANELAARGLNLVLVARRKERLDELAGSVAAAHGVRAIPEPFDLSTPGMVARLRESLCGRGIRIRLLCSCAGFGRWGRAERQALATYDEMIGVNVGAVTALSLGFFEDLASHPSSAIIHVSSVAALQPVPYMAVYAATKAYIHSFGQALYEEWREHGVYVQTLAPGPTTTEFDDIAGAYPTAAAVGDRASPQRVVRESLRNLEKRTPVVFVARGAFKQRLLAALVPPKVFLRVAGKLFRPPRNSGKVEVE